MLQGCFSCTASCVCNCWAAAFPPKPTLEVPALIRMVHHALETAEVNGAFVAALQASFIFPAWHVARHNLVDQVVQALTSPEVKGVLITGFRGMGKTPLAQAVLTAFSKQPGADTFAAQF